MFKKILGSYPLLKQNSMFRFLKKKKKKKNEKPSNSNFQIFILITRSFFFSPHGQNFVNDMNNKWCEGKHFLTINEVYTKENLLRLLNSEEFSKFILPNLALHCPFGQCC